MAIEKSPPLLNYLPKNKYISYDQFLDIKYVDFTVDDKSDVFSGYLFDLNLLKINYFSYNEILNFLMELKFYLKDTEDYLFKFLDYDNSRGIVYIPDANYIPFKAKTYNYHVEIDEIIGQIVYVCEEIK